MENYLIGIVVSNDFMMNLFKNEFLFLMLLMNICQVRKNIIIRL